jgi:hypothetical protein
MTCKLCHSKWIIPPDRIKYNGAHCYRILIAGILYTFIVTEKPLPIDAGQIAINEQGNFLMTIDCLENIEFLREQVTQHSKALNERLKITEK